MCRGTQCPRAGEGCGPGALVCLENFFLCKFSFGGDKFHHTPGLAQTEVLQTLLGAAGTWSLGECRCPSPLRHREAPALSTTWGGGCAGELWLGENRLREQLSCRSRGALGKHLKHKPSSSSFSRKTPNQCDFCCKKQLQIHTLSNSWWLPASLWKHVLIQKNNSKISVQKPGPAPPNRHLYHITPAATQTRREALGLYPLPASTCATHGAKTTPDGRHKNDPGFFLCSKPPNQKGPVRAAPAAELHSSIDIAMWQEKDLTQTPQKLLGFTSHILTPG